MIPAALWANLMSVKGEAGPDDRLFDICQQHVWRIVKRIALEAGVTGDISPHWFRLAHASHALEKGATLAQVKETLGHTDVKTTSSWRMMPHDLPPWDVFISKPERWLKAGVFQALVHDLRAVLRIAEGRQEMPTAPIFDSRTMQSTVERGACTVYCA